MIEVRYAKLAGGRQEFDEVVATRDVQSVHLEKINAREFCLIIETRNERAQFFIGTAAAAVDGHQFSRDPINRRSEAQRRRWNALSKEQRRRRKR